MSSEPQRPAPKVMGSSRTFLALILIVGAVIRCQLALTGGQYFFGDEGRFDRGYEAYAALRTGNWAALRDAFNHADHAGFTVVSTATVAIQHQLARVFTPWGNWAGHPEYYTFSIGLAACVLSMAGVLGAWLVYRIALAAGAPREEALWACLLASLANTSVMYGPHLLGYDSSLAIFLGALLLVIGAPRDSRCIIAGLLTGASYHVYNGYWYFTPLLAGFLLLQGGFNRTAIRQLVLFSAGAGAVIFGGYLLGLWVYGSGFLRFAVAFSGTVVQGMFSEGWSFPWEFLTHSESYLGLFVLLGVTIAFVREKAWQPAHRRVSLWLGLLALAYLLVVVASCGFHKFVVYARTVKPFIPLLCLLGGWAVHVLVQKSRGGRFAVACLILVLAGWNLAPHFGRLFPREFEIAVMKAVGNPKRTLTVSGSLYIPLAMPVTAPNYALVNAQYLYPIRKEEPSPAGLVVMRVPNPLSYLPFQYECHSPAMRTFLRRADIDMRLIRLEHPEQVPNDLPVALRFQPTDRPDGVTDQR